MTREPATLLSKLWDEHVIKRLPGGDDLLHVDRFFLHDLGGPIVIPELQRANRTPLAPELNFGVTDHGVSTEVGREHRVDEIATKFMHGMRKAAREFGLRHFDVGQADQGIVHVIGPQLGLTLPGTTFLCTDSHTCTHGALGALAWGVGSSDANHILSTQTIAQRKPKALRINIEGRLPAGVYPKDVILYTIGRFGSAFGTGYAVEFAGPAIQAMSVEGRLTICNMSVEIGSKTGMIAPDETTYEYLAGRQFAPRGDLWDRAVLAWRELHSDADAIFDVDVSVQTGDLRPQVSWGTSVDQMASIDGHVPDPDEAPDQKSRSAIAAALDYMNLRPGDPVEGLPIQHAFIGSCTNGRLSDLVAAASLLRGRKIAAGVRGWVVPGSTAIKQEAEARGLDLVFKEAGFDWRESGCSLCCAANGESVPRGERCVSTSNRNFVGRQGPGARTHLASPVTAAASAIAGCLADPRKFIA